jgi:hypothetical protein
MQHSVAFETNDCSAGQEIPCFGVMFIALLTKLNSEDCIEPFKFSPRPELRGFSYITIFYDWSGDVLWLRK